MGDLSAASRVAVPSMVVALVIGLSSCATAGDEPPLAAPEPPSSPTATGDPLAPPSPLFDLDCDDLVPAQQIVDLYGSGAGPLDFTYAGVDEMSLLVGAAMADGALVCHWARPGDTRPIMTITATEAAPTDYAVSYAGFDEIPRPSPPVPILDGARAECYDDVPAANPRVWCDWSVYSADVWIVAHFDGLPSSEVDEPATRVNPDTSANRPTARADSLSALIVSGAATRLTDSERMAIDRADLVLTTCGDVVDRAATALEAIGTVQQSYDLGSFDINSQISAFAPFGGAIGALGIQRQGWTRCSLIVDSAVIYGGPLITIGQGAAWLLAEGAPGTRHGQPLTGGEGVTHCVMDEGGPYCTVALSVREHLVAVTMSTEDQAATESLARAVAELLD